MQDEARAVLEACRAGKLTLATAESCTGGMIAATLTDIAGASEVVDRGFVTYSNAAKMAVLGVPPELLAEHGAVSAPVAEAMVGGALARAPVDLAVAVTGIAGPGGGTPVKPVGLVFIAVQRRGGPAQVERHVFAGDRAEVRTQATERALALLAAAALTPA